VHQLFQWGVIPDKEGHFSHFDRTSDQGMSIVGNVHRAVAAPRIGMRRLAFRIAQAKRRATVRGGSQASIESDLLYLQNLFSANVRLVRVAQGISQEALADRASLDRT
jgi:hypothetical protein